MSPANNLTQQKQLSNTPPAAPQLTPLKLFHTWLDLHRAGDLDAALAIGDVVYSLTPEHRDLAIERIGHFVLLEAGGVL